MTDNNASKEHAKYLISHFDMGKERIASAKDARPDDPLYHSFVDKRTEFHEHLFRIFPERHAGWHGKDSYIYHINPVPLILHRKNGKSEALWQTQALEVLSYDKFLECASKIMPMQEEREAATKLLTKWNELGIQAVVEGIVEKTKDGEEPLIKKFMLPDRLISRINPSITKYYDFVTPEEKALEKS